MVTVPMVGWSASRCVGIGLSRASTNPPQGEGGNVHATASVTISQKCGLTAGYSRAVDERGVA